MTDLKKCCNPTRNLNYAYVLESDSVEYKLFVEMPLVLLSRKTAGQHCLPLYTIRLCHSTSFIQLGVESEALQKHALTHIQPYNNKMSSTKGTFPFTTTTPRQVPKLLYK